MTRFKYIVFWCKDCEIDFLFRANKRNKSHAYCPACGDNIATEKTREIWSERHYVQFKNWSPEEDDILIECRKRKMTAKETLELLEGRTDKAVYRRIKQLKIKGRIEA